MTWQPPRPAFVSGVGMTDFGKHENRTLTDLACEASIKAIVDAGVLPSDIEAAYCGSALAGILQRDSGVGQSVLMELGITRVPVINVENACATGATALHLAWRDVAYGIHDVVLAFGVDKAVMPKGTVLAAGTATFEAQLGDIFPGTFALIAQRHMSQYGTTAEQMALVSVKNHDNGVLNPYAQFNKPMTLDDVLNSPMIAEPLTLFSCCPNSDGAAAAVVCSRDWLERTMGGAVRIGASVLASGDYDPKRDMTYWESEAFCAQQAYKAAGISALDVDVVEVHDAFTISEIVHCETLGFCKRGDGGAFTESGATGIHGQIPINPSGGLLARGHPPGASGLAQIFELTTQLRGTADARQVKAPSVALAQIMGGSKANDAQACAVHILMKDLD
ncbi:thiolase family protein [Hoeflea alexandrii]|uniref:thiolase family protein n=1 Tax=Hoeflea alexandrii TaxID=288436 RepID=UPI0022AE8A05|nr:thiolase family protein [Hoeflea alexandrii]MCZ4291665.1 thiolase family protein [Hoeflea alexandrii]